MDPSAPPSDPDVAGPAGLQLVVRGDQHDFIQFARALAARGHFAVHAGRHHLLRGLLRVLLVGRREVVDGVLHHVARVYGFLQTAGDAVHVGEVRCPTKTRGQKLIRLPL